MVLISHGRSILNPIFNSTDFMSLGGFWGVELFFVLSGFLIGGILIKIFEKEDSFDKEIILSFWKRRWFRTLPNYYLILIINVLIAIAIGRFVFNDIRYYSIFLFFQNFFTRHPGFFGEAWSLAVEEWFYLIFPVILFFVNSLLFPLQKKQSKFLISIIIVFLCSFILKLITVIYLNAEWDSGIRKIVPLRLDSILTGVLFAWLNYYKIDVFVKYKKIMLVFAFFLLTISLFNYYNDILKEGILESSFFSKTLYFNITSLGFAFLLPYANSNRTVGLKSIWRKGVTLISLISYSMYLIHYSFVFLVINRLSKINDSIMFSIIMYCCYFGITIIFSILLYKYFEKPMTDLRDFNSNTKGLNSVKSYVKKGVMVVSNAIKP
ncbi:hypothetical protein A8C32_18830 [Flavivirga aquatica]|uniref:Acyltransferase 3 domain-containing protein n=2 Tax=Flavivirga aquatica TaxID=1849968 RepID=A0A1E5T489_9FLAO|nr:hypothetical protein A8C32_18830 [Flavivirga aquatica]